MGGTCCQDNSDKGRNEMNLLDEDGAKITWKEKKSTQKVQALKPEDNPFYVNSPKIITETEIKPKKKSAWSKVTGNKSLWAMVKWMDYSSKKSKVLYPQDFVEKIEEIPYVY